MNRDNNLGFKCPNPKCKKDLDFGLSDLVSRGKVHCTRCGSEMLFKSSAISTLRTAISQLKQAQERVDKALHAVMESPEIRIKS